MRLLCKSNVPLRSHECWRAVIACTVCKTIWSFGDVADRKRCVLINGRVLEPAAANAVEGGGNRECAGGFASVRPRAMMRLVHGVFSFNMFGRRFASRFASFAIWFGAVRVRRFVSFGPRRSDD